MADPLIMSQSKDSFICHILQNPDLFIIQECHISSKKQYQIRGIGEKKVFIIYVVMKQFLKMATLLLTAVGNRDKTTVKVELDWSQKLYLKCYLKIIQSSCDKKTFGRKTLSKPKGAL